MRVEVCQTFTGTGDEEGWVAYLEVDGRITHKTRGYSDLGAAFAMLAVQLGQELMDDEYRGTSWG